MKRGDGATTRQMESAPKRAVFIWCNAYTIYPLKMAHHLGREDLLIKSPDWLKNSWRGLELTGVVVDHSAILTHTQLEGYQGALTRIRSRAYA